MQHDLSLHAHAHANQVSPIGINRPRLLWWLARSSDADEARADRNHVRRPWMDGRQDVDWERDYEGLQALADRHAVLRKLGALLSFAQVALLRRPQ